MLKRKNGYPHYINQFSYDYPFKYLSDLFAKDDLTLINLEGVFADSSKGENKKKDFAFRGTTDYGQILTQGSIEIVNLANNHSLDYGKQGMERDRKSVV